MECCIRDGVLVYGLGVLGWGVDIQDELLYTEWAVSKRDGVLVNGMGCYFAGWGVSKRNSVLISGMGC